MHRRTALVLLVLGVGGLASWLLIGRGGEQGESSVVSREDAPTTQAELAEAPAAQDVPSLVGTSDAEPTHAPLGTVGDVTVRVLGRGDVPLPDVPVFRIGELGEIAGVEVTDVQGQVVFDELAYGGEAWIAAPRLGDERRLEPGERRRVMGPTMVLRVDLGMPCEVVPVDVSSGRVLPDLATGLVPRLATPHTLRVPPRTGRRLVLARPGTDLALELAVDVPAGYVLWAHDEPYMKISRYARALRYVVPLHREADVEVDVLEHDGSPARDPYVSAWSLSGKEGAAAGDAETERLAVNRLRIRQVPYVEGARLEVRVGLEAAADHRLAIATTPLARRTRLVVHLPHPDEYTLSDVPFKGPAPGMVGLGGGGDSPPPVPPEGGVELTAVLRDGSLAAGATVYLRYLEEGYALRAFRAVLDDQGRYENDIPEGTWRVHYYEPGLVQSGTTFEVRAGQSTRVRLQEGEGGTVQVRVVGPDGRPLPFAVFRINDWMWRDLVDGVQRLDPYVDERGARTLRHVSPGDFEVSAWYAGGTATSEVTVIEGETVSVTVEVDPAE